MAWGTELLAADATPAAAFNPTPPGPGTPAGEPTAKNQDHANAIATVQWPNAYAAIGVHGVVCHSGSLKMCRKYSELAAGHERDLVFELRDYEASGGDLDAIREHIDDAASARVWEIFLENYKCFLRTGDDEAADEAADAAVAALSLSEPDAASAMETGSSVHLPRKNSNLPPKDKFWIDSMSHGPVEWRDITKV